MSEKPDETLHCYKHPDRETLLRCNKCGRPICQDCAVQTPVGYRCKECIAEQQKVFETATYMDIFLGFVVGAAFGFFSAVAVPYIPLGAILRAVLCGLVFGTVTAAVIRKAVNRRRSKWLSIMVCVGTLFGAVFVLCLNQDPDWLSEILFLVVLLGTIWSELNDLIIKW